MSHTISLDVILAADTMSHTISLDIILAADTMSHTITLDVILAKVLMFMAILACLCNDKTSGCWPRTIAAHH